MLEKSSHRSRRNGKLTARTLPAPPNALRFLCAFAPLREFIPGPA
jgi:hypothetical protein